MRRGGAIVTKMWTHDNRLLGRGLRAIEGCRRVYDGEPDEPACRVRAFCGVFWAAYKMAAAEKTLCIKSKEEL